MAVLSRLTTAVTTTAHTSGLRHLPFFPTAPHSFSTCSTAASAAAQLHFDYYDEFTTPIAPALDTEPSRTSRGVQWVFIGSPNSKKHVYAEMISKVLEVPRISITSLLRQDLNPQSLLYKQLAESVNHKRIVPETIIFGLLSKRLEDGHYRGESGFILDGIPRTRLQAEILDELVDIDLVVNFKCPVDHFQAEASSVDSTGSCPRTTLGSSSLKSSEDVEPNVTTFYREQTKLLEDYYQNQKKLIDFQVGTAPGETWKGLIATLHLQHVNAVHSFKRLTRGSRVP